MRLGIVGFGGMGSWLARRALDSGIDVVGLDKDPSKVSAVPGARNAGSLLDLLEQSDLVIVAVTPGSTVEVLKSIGRSAESIRWSGGVADISTFKKRIIPVLQGLPDGIDVASLHPLFGPKASRIDAHKVLVVPVPGRTGAEAFKDLLDRMGLAWEEVDHVEHDRLMGLAIGLPYAIGHALARIVGVDELKRIYRISGTTFKSLYLLLSTLSDSEELVNHILEDPDTARWVSALAGELGKRYPGREDLGLYDALYCLVEDCLMRGQRVS